MTKTRKVFLGAFAAIFVFALAFFFTACNTDYTLTFMDGDTVIDTVVGPAGTSVTAPDASKDDYELVGWYLNSDFSGDAVEIPATIPAQNVTYYAKYAALYTVTIDTDGGSYEDVSIKLAEGTNLLEGLSSKNVSNPTKTGLVFGAWYIGDDEVTSSTVVPSNNITIKAKYMVEYTVEFYLESADDGTYAIDSSRTKTATDWEGATCSPSVSVTGYELVTTSDSIESLTLSATDKVFKFYFDIAEYTISYNANVPSGSTSTGVTLSAYANYESVIILEDCGYSIEGYRFLGWATTATATSAQYAAGSSYTVTGNTVLYAVWDRGYADRNGGSDYVYIVDGSNILFVRAGAEFNGTYAITDGLMLFSVAVGSVTYTGLIASDYTFVFYNSAQAATYTYAANYGTTTTVATLKLDGYYTATYTEGSGEDAVEYEGTYNLVSSSTSTYYFSSADTGFYFRLGTDSESNNVFYIMDIEGYFGYMYLTSLYSLKASSSGYSYSIIGYYYGYYVYCDGFGTGYIDDDSNGISGTYSYVAEEYSLDEDGESDTLQITFSDADGNEVYRIFVTVLSNSSTSFYAYFLYNGDVAGTLTLSDSSTLKLDGYAYNATYTNAEGTALSGKYSYDESILGGYYINFVDESGDYEYKFYLDESKNLTLCGEEAGAYYYITDLYYAYDLVIYLDGAGKVILYDVSGSTIYQQTSVDPVQVATGTYTYDKESDTYTLTLDTSSYASGYDVYSKLVITLYSDDVYEMVSSTAGDVTTSYFVTYTASDKTTMTVHGDEGIFTYNDGTKDFEGYIYISGTDETTGTNWYYGYYYNSDLSSYVYLTYNVYTDSESNNVLVKYDLIPRTSSYYSQYGSTDSTITLYLDGLGNAVYTNGTTVINGEYSAVSDTEYSFTSDDGATTFEFMLLMASSSSSYVYYFAVYDSTFGTLAGADGSTLVVDGYGFTATYVTADGDVYEGYYYFYDENNDTIIFSCDDLGYTVYFYLTDATNYVVYDRYSGFYYSTTADGDIDGVYYLYLNGDGEFYLLDYYNYSQYFYYFYYYYGYSYSNAVNNARYYSLMAYGEYIVTDEDSSMLELIITEDYDEVITDLGSRFSVKLGGVLYSVFYIYDSDYELTFTSSDGSVLALDGVGNAAYSTAKGEKTTGDYRFEQSVDGTDVIIVGDYAFAVDYDAKTFELYATLIGAYYDYYYYYYGYGGEVVWVWEMTDGTQTISLDLTDSYYAYAGGMDYLEDVAGNDMSLWFIPFITYSSGYYTYIEYIYEYEYTSGSTTYTIHYDGLISLYYYTMVVGSGYDVTYVTTSTVDENFTLIKYLYYSDSSLYSIALADANGNLLNSNYFYYNYLTGSVYEAVDSTTYIYFTEDYAKVYKVSLGTTASVEEITASTLTDSTSTYTMYYVEYGGEVYLLYVTSGETKINVYTYWYIDENENYLLVTGYDDEYNYTYFLLDESGSSKQLLVCNLLTDITSADKNYELGYLVVCDGKVYYAESLYYGDYSILDSASIGDNITENNGEYTITFKTEASNYVATLTYSDNKWSLSITATSIEYTATDSGIEVKFTLDEAGNVTLSSVTINGSDTKSNYDLSGYTLTYNGETVNNGTVVSITFTTEGTLTYVTRYVLTYNNSNIGYYEYSSAGELENFVAADDYTVISSYTDEDANTLTVYASYEDSGTKYVSCVVTLGTSTVTVSSLNTRKVAYYAEDNSELAVITLLIDDQGAAKEILSVIYNGSNVTSSVGALETTSDGKYVVIYSLYAYVITLGETSASDTVEQYTTSTYVLYTYYLYTSSLYLVKFDYSTTTYEVEKLNSMYVYEDGEYVPVTLPSDSSAYTITTSVSSSLTTCTVTFTSGDVEYSILFYYISSIGSALPTVTATYTLTASNTSNVVLSYYTTESGSGFTITPDTLTVNSNEYSYSGIVSNISSDVYLLSFTASGLDDVYLLFDMSGSTVVCYRVYYETVTVNGTYRFSAYYYVYNNEVVIVSLSSSISVYDDQWNGASVTFDPVEGEDNAYTFTYGEKTYKVAFSYDSTTHGLTATIVEVVATGNE